ncbi:MAG: OmpH family outer membrane protein [bacterium]
MKQKLIVIILFLFASICFPVYAQNLKIAVVDTDKVFNDSVWGKNVVLEMEREAEKWQKEGERIDKELANLEEKLAKQRSFLNDKEQEQKLENEIENKRMEGQKLVQDGNAKLKIKRDELLQPILDEVKEIIRKLAIEEGYDLVLEKQLIVLYLNPEIDITSKVTVMLDKVYKDKYSSKAEEAKKAPEKASKPKEDAKPVDVPQKSN